MQARAPVPAVAWFFGVVSILPLFVAAGVYCYGPRTLGGPALLALVSYSTALLAYLGGIRCGQEVMRRIPRWHIMGLSMLAPFVGFALLFGAAWFDVAWQISGYLLAFLLQWIWDVNDHEGPAWRPRFRTMLTAGAAIPLALALEQALRQTEGMNI